ncbi:hypothetical protein ACLKA7_004785 [Drosophila subpalustris]
MGRQRKQRRKQRKRKHQRRRQQRALLNATAAAAAAAGGVAATGAARDAVSTEIWSSTYHSLLQWHQQQVLRICRPREENSTEDEEEAEEEEEKELEEEGEQEEEELPFEVDPDYLSFLEVTIKHQEELKQARAAAATAEA